MDNISFIPANQKNINGQVLPYSNSKPYSTTFMWITIFLVIYGIVVALGYWFFIAERKSMITEKITDLDSQNANYYPQGNLEQSFFNITDIIQKRRDINKIIQSVEATFIPNLRVKNIVYIKKNNTLLLSAVAPTISDVTTQVAAINKLPEILPSDAPSIEQLENNEGASFNLIINLK